MAQHKDYGLIGVGNSVQLGKQGPKVVRDGGSYGINITDEDGVTAVTVSGANATQSNHFVTKAQLDSVALDALVSTFEYNSSTVSMGTIDTGTKTIQTVLTVDNAFDGNTVVSVGTDSNNTLLMSAPYNDLSATGDYITVNTVEFSTTETIKIFVTQGTSTVGNGTVVVSVLDGPVNGYSGSSGSGIALTDLSVTILDPIGNGSLSYSNTTGVFEFTPADASGGGASVGGSDTQIQYNNSGSLAGSTNLTFDGSSTTYAALLETGRLSTQNSTNTLQIGTKDGSTYRHGIQLSNGGTSASVVLYGQLSTASDTAGNRSFDFSGTDLYNLPLANITNVSSTAPTNGQALVWNSSTSEWEPGNVYSDSSVVTLLNNLGSNSISTTGNINAYVDGYEIGYRNIPQISWSSNVTLALTDSGKHYYTTSASNISVTVPADANVAFAIGDTVNLMNHSNSTMTVGLQSGVSMYLAGNSTSSTRTISGYGVASLTKVATDTWFITGVGVS